MAIPEPLPRVAAFEKLGFGMFIHWGLYSQLGKGEWIMHLERIPKEAYCKLFSSFTASDFQPDRIVETAKRAGMKYIVLTTRHHEGFSLYDTCGLSDYDAPHSPARRDLVKEFVEACRKGGILPFFYHTTLDWYQESFEQDFDGYLDYLHKSVEILCTNYGPIGGLWFDGNWSKPEADWKEERLYGIIRKHQPNAIIVNNTGLGARGRVGNLELDSVTFEQGRPNPMNREGMEKYLAAEMCQTINENWGIGTMDLKYKSTGELIETLCSCRKVGANYLLNVGPGPQGAILPLQENMLALIGEWIRRYENCIYEAKPAGILGTGKNFALKGPDGCLYFFIHDLSRKGDDNVTVSLGGAVLCPFNGVSQTISEVTWMDNHEPLAFCQNPVEQMLLIKATPYPYGENTVVRVAKATVKC